MPFLYIDDDFVRVKTGPGKNDRFTLAFGDKIEVTKAARNSNENTEIVVHGYRDGPFKATVKGKLKTRKKGVLKFSMVDVQQGDGMIFETPDEKKVFIDGGDNQLFARHVAARYRHKQTSKTNPMEIDAIIITHGDADHFDGLNKIVRSETDKRIGERKRLFIHPKRIYHNGLVKASRAGRKDVEMFGRTVENGNDIFIVDLVDDPSNPAEVSPTRLNKPFRSWVNSINRWKKYGPILLRRIAFGDNSHTVFDFLEEEGIHVDIQGPFLKRPQDPKKGNKRVEALPMLHQPEKAVEIHLDNKEADGRRYSASHTINGHSISLKLTYGNVRFSLTGDLNNESMNVLNRRITDPKRIEAEIVKAAHHGSSDFNLAALKKMSPVVSIISSGDESAKKEHIHPRATLMAALGRANRGDTGIVLCTELAAFFEVRNYSHTRADLAAYFKSKSGSTFTADELSKMFSGKNFKVDKGFDGPKYYFGFHRSNFGIIHIRTDGERVLVFTHSGKKGMNEAYRFMVYKNHKVKFAKKVTKH